VEFRIQEAELRKKAEKAEKEYRIRKRRGDWETEYW
jgi:hypothetical protein